MSRLKAHISRGDCPYPVKTLESAVAELELAFRFASLQQRTIFRLLSLDDLSPAAAISVSEVNCGIFTSATSVSRGVARGRGGEAKEAELCRSSRAPGQLRQAEAMSTN